MQNIIFENFPYEFEVKCTQIFQANLFSKNPCEFGEPWVQ